MGLAPVSLGGRAVGLVLGGWLLSGFLSGKSRIGESGDDGISILGGFNTTDLRGRGGLPVSSLL